MFLFIFSNSIYQSHQVNNFLAGAESKPIMRTSHEDERVPESDNGHGLVAMMVCPKNMKLPDQDDQSVQGE